MSKGNAGYDTAMRALADLPGPKGLPFLGNFLQLDLPRLHKQLEAWCREFGTVYLFRMGRKPVVVVADPESIQTVLRNRPKLYRRVGAIEPVFNEMEITGVFSAEGEDWKRQRRMTAPAFDAHHLRQFFPTLIKVTQRLKKRWEKAAESGATVDVQQDLVRYTVDVTTNLAFGYDMNTLEKEGDIIQEHLEKIFPMINRRVNAVFPYWRYFKLKEDRSLDKALVAIRETIAGFVRDGRARLIENPQLAVEPTNLLEALLTARDENNAPLTDTEIHGNILTILLAGEDTTANSMAWMMHFMTEHPDVQSRMRTEARSVLGAEQILTRFPDIERLDYIEAAAHEAMRLKPVVPILFLESIEDVEIAGIQVPKQTPVMLLMQHGGQEEMHFGGAQEFRPDRWLQSAGTGGCPHNPRAFVPFGAGPRFCPGRQLAMLEIKMVMAMLCSEFEISSSESKHPVEELFSFTMMPQNLFVRFKRLDGTPG
jgi:cytochrome P450